MFNFIVSHYFCSIGVCNMFEFIYIYILCGTNFCKYFSDSVGVRIGISLA